jgi:septal ring factor EnvC (AmiA/AmiB activator)
MGCDRLRIINTITTAVTQLSKLLVVMSFGMVLSGHGNQLLSEKELKSLKSRIDKLQVQLQAGRSEEQILIRNLESLERESARLVEQQHAHNINLASFKARKKKLHQKSLDLALQDDAAQTRLKEVVRSSYILGQQDSIKLLLNQNDPIKFARTLAMYRYFVRARGRQIDEIRGYRTEVRNTAREIALKEVEIDQALSNINTNKLALKDAEDTRRKQLRLIQQELIDDQTRIEIFQKREVELELLLSNLQRQKSREYRKELKTMTPEAETAGIRSSNQAQGHVTRNQSAAGGFGSQRGRLEKPTVATIKNRYGQIKPESGLVWEGLMFDVHEGQRVSAVYPGQVVFSDWFRGYGQLLVLDHGDGYMSLYGHNQLIHVELGSAVTAGQLVAYAGSTGGLANPGLYFEIRHNGAPDDPSKWLRL